MVASRPTQIALLRRDMSTLLPGLPFRDDESRVVVDLPMGSPGRRRGAGAACPRSVQPVQLGRTAGLALLRGLPRPCFEPCNPWEWASILRKKPKSGQGMGPGRSGSRLLRTQYTILRKNTQYSIEYLCRATSIRMSPS